MDDKQLVFEALRRGLITPEEAKRRLTPNRAGEIAGQAGTGIVRAGINLLGLPGDIESLGTVKGTRGDINLSGTNSESLPKVMPSSQEIESALARATGQPLPKPVYPEGKYVSAVTEGMASMLSPKKWPLIMGGLSGIGGEVSKLWQLPGGKATGNLAVLAPWIASHLFKPWDVKALGPWVKRIGDNVIDSGGWAANQVAKHLGTETTSLANQVPQLAPLYDWAQASEAGKPLANVAASTREGVQNLTSLPNDPEVIKALTNVVKRPETLDPLSGMVSDVQEGLRSSPADLIKRLPYMPVSAIDNWSHIYPPKRLAPFVEELASPEAHDYLQGLGNYNTTNEVTQALARALLSTDIQQDPPPLRIDITGGNQ